MLGLQRATVYGYSLFEFGVYGAAVAGITQPAAPPSVVEEGTVNLASGRPATASSTYYGFPASNTTDGNLSSRWSSQFSSNEWIHVDLGTSSTIQRVVLTWEAAYARSYRIQVSSDAANWSDVYSTSTGDGGTDDITLASAATGRYVRMLGLQRATVYGYSLFEFGVYGAAVAGITQSAAPPSAAEDGATILVDAAVVDVDASPTQDSSLAAVSLETLDLDRRVRMDPAGRNQGTPATVADAKGKTWVVWHAGDAGERQVYATSFFPTMRSSQKPCG
jgi:hypothetical protein